MQQHILIVENDIALAKTIAEHLRGRNYLCSTASSVTSALAEITRFSYDLIILDRVLDDGDGIEIAEYLQDYTSTTKVIVLSSKKAVEERIAGLKQGADDYLCKPFSLVELTLKIQKLLSMQKMHVVDELNLGEITIRPESGEIRLGSLTKTMRKKECAILSCLVRYKNQVVSRNTLISSVWGVGDVVPSHATLDVYIRRIRMFLGEYKDCVQTVRGFGYSAQG